MNNNKYAYAIGDATRHQQHKIHYAAEIGETIIGYQGLSHCSHLMLDKELGKIRLDLILLLPYWKSYGNFLTFLPQSFIWREYLQGIVISVSVTSEWF